MAGPRWLSRFVVEVIHSELLAEHGGAKGMREGGEDLLEAALARPRNRHAYDSAADLADFAAAYLFGLVMSHGFIDGNKRLGFACAATFQRINGLRLTAPEVEAYDRVIGLIEGRYTEADVAVWIRANSEPVQ